MFASVQPGRAPAQRPPLQSSAGSRSCRSSPDLFFRPMILLKPVVSCGASSRPPSMGKPLGTPTLSTRPRKSMPAPTLKWRFFLEQLAACWPTRLFHLSLKCPSKRLSCLGGSMGWKGSLGSSSRLAGALGATTKAWEYISCSFPSVVHLMRTTTWSPTVKPTLMGREWTKLQGASPAAMSPMATLVHLAAKETERLATGSSTWLPTFR
mmetsp:Transcript_82301/g.255616  ORF Transcript_82301/g.255616 Transcript_82301/m.255616 type:complete len:209 (-) Transcript_82301:422-1048(-)